MIHDILLRDNIYQEILTGDCNEAANDYINILLKTTQSTINLQKNSINLLYWYSRKSININIKQS